MENNNKQRNLASLKAEFHDKGKAARGLKTIKSYIAISDETGLDHLLRHHSKGTVYSRELEQRFEIDALIEFYNLLLIAALVGYVPAGLDVDLRNEIQEVLDNDAVWLYYAERYPYKMTELTLNYVKTHNYFETKEDPRNISLFYEFISLNRLLKRDEDILRFMGMLDHVTYKRNSLEDVTETLVSYKKLNKALTSQKLKNKKQRAVWGFIKYTAFLTQLKALFEMTDDARLRSAMWLFHGYYLDRMNMEMREKFELAFSNLEQALADEDLFKALAQETTGQTAATDLSKDELKAYAQNTMQQMRADIAYILDPHWKTPLLEHFYPKM